MGSVMEVRRIRQSLFLLSILILTVIEQMMLFVMAHHDSQHYHITRRIHLLHAVTNAKKFLCREPQMRAYNLRDLVQNLHPSESANQPVYIVLKRCDSHAGCCVSPDLSCMPVRSSIYYEEIEIEVWSLETNRTRREWIRVEQHSNCSCEISNANERLSHDTQLPSVKVL